MSHQSPYSVANDAAYQSDTTSVGSGGSRPRHRRGLSGVTPRELKYIDSTLPAHLRQQWKKFSVKPIDGTEDFERNFVRNVETTLARSLYNVDTLAAYQASALSVRDSLIVKWSRTQQKHTLVNPKRVYYLSLEWLMGRALDNALLNLGIKPDVRDGLNDFGFNLEDVIEREPDAGLGNGGLGRLAACYIDSLSTLEYPAWGYGLRYQFGIFRQKIVDGTQVEFPDSWLSIGDPWEIPRNEFVIDVPLYGEVEERTDENGNQIRKWVSGDVVEARAYDMPIPGYQTENVNNLRLWSAVPSEAFDFSQFNEGKYRDAVAEQVDASTITSVLYPNDNFYEGKELRLKQQYFWVSASLADIVRRFKNTGKKWTEFPDYTAIQLNDTHPTMAIVEFLRILLDKENIEWSTAWDITTRTFAYTNHTVMSEALEKWPVDVIAHLLPRHLEIIYQINYFFLQDVQKAFPGDDEILRNVSLIEESEPKQVRMAFLAVVGSHKVNGVAELHSDLIKTTIFKDFVKVYGSDKFTNVTNGITPRRWLLEANPELAALIAEKLGGFGYLKKLDHLKALRNYINDPEFRTRWQTIKRDNKTKLIGLLNKIYGRKLDINPNALFDIQVKRIHEYKRQQLNIFGVIYRYLVLKSLSPAEREQVLPRVAIFGGKSAPGYYMAKTIIHLINSVADVVNNDPEVNKQLQVYYVEEYNVSKSQVLTAASDISEHISTAGTEASGTSNMKFVLNGGLIIGTVDGANIEIGREVGEDNVFFFGHLSESVEQVRESNRKNGVDLNPKLAEVFAAVERGQFGNADFFRSLLDTVRFNDHYLVSADFDAYLAAQAKIDVAFANPETWLTKSISVVSNMGFFSSDRAVTEYAETIWNVEPVPVEKEDSDLIATATSASSKSTTSAPVAARESFGTSSQPATGAAGGDSVTKGQNPQLTDAAGHSASVASPTAAQGSEKWEKGIATSDRHDNSGFDSARHAAAIAAGAVTGAGAAAAATVAGLAHANSRAPGQSTAGADATPAGQFSAPAGQSVNNHQQAPAAGTGNLSTPTSTSTSGAVYQGTPSNTTQMASQENTANAASQLGSNEDRYVDAVESNDPSSTQGGITGAVAGATGAVTGAAGAVAAAIGLSGSSQQSGSAAHPHDLAAIADEAKAHTTEGYKAGQTTRDANWNVVSAAEDAKAHTTEGYKSANASVYQRNKDLSTAADEARAHTTQGYQTGSQTGSNQQKDLSTIADEAKAHTTEGYKSTTGAATGAAAGVVGAVGATVAAGVAAVAGATGLSGSEQKDLSTAADQAKAHTTEGYSKKLEQQTEGNTNRLNPAYAEGSSSKKLEQQTEGNTNRLNPAYAEGSSGKKLEQQTEGNTNRLNPAYAEGSSSKKLEQQTEGNTNRLNPAYAQGSSGKKLEQQTEGNTNRLNPAYAQGSSGNQQKDLSTIADEAKAHTTEGYKSTTGTATGVAAGVVGAVGATVAAGVAAVAGATGLSGSEQKDLSTAADQAKAHTTEGYSKKPEQLTEGNTNRLNPAYAEGSSGKKLEQQTEGNTNRLNPAYAEGSSGKKLEQQTEGNTNRLNPAYAEGSSGKKLEQQTEGNTNRLNAAYAQGSSKAGNAVNGVSGTVGNAVHGATGTVGNAVNGATGTVGNAVNGVTGTAGKTINGATGTVGAAGAGLAGAVGVGARGKEAEAEALPAAQKVTSAPTKGERPAAADAEKSSRGCCCF